MAKENTSYYLYSNNCKHRVAFAINKQNIIVIAVCSTVHWANVRERTGYKRYSILNIDQITNLFRFKV